MLGQLKKFGSGLTAKEKVMRRESGRGMRCGPVHPEKLLELFTPILTTDRSRAECFGKWYVEPFSLRVGLWPVRRNTSMAYTTTLEE